MGVFLRWGVFGIVAVAALLYAYNASKRLSERRAAERPVASQDAVDEDDAAEDQAETAADTEREAAPEEETEAGPEMPAPCAEEQRVAERALKMRRDGDRLDRLLRIDIIVF